MTERPRVGEILVAAGIIDELQLSAALGEQARWGRRLGVTLIKMGMVEEGHLIRALAKQLDLPVASLAGKRIPDEVIALVPARVASEHCVIPLFTRKNGNVSQLYLGMEDPSNFNVLDDLSFRTGMEIHPVMVGPSELGAAIDRYYHGRFGTTPTVDPFHKARKEHDRNVAPIDVGSLRIVTDDAPHPGTAPIDGPVDIPSAAPSTSPITSQINEATKPVVRSGDPDTSATPVMPVVSPSPSPSKDWTGARAVVPPSPPATVDDGKEHATPVRPTPGSPPVSTIPEIELSDRMERNPDGLLDDVARALSETERTRVVAKAMAQLLIQKGILSLDEIHKQIAQVKAKSGSDEPA